MITHHIKRIKKTNLHNHLKISGEKNAYDKIQHSPMTTREKIVGLDFFSQPAKK